MTPLERYRATGHVLTVQERIELIRDLAELHGFEAQLVADGRADPLVLAQIGKRRVALERGRA